MRHINYCLLFFVSLIVSAQSYSDEEKSNGRVLLDKSVISNDMVLFDQAVLMSTEGDWYNAEKVFRDVSLRNPRWPEPKNNLAIALFNMGKLEQARRALDEAVASLPSFKTAQANRQQLNDYTATIAYYKVVNIPEEPELPKLKILAEIQHLPTIATLKSDSKVVPMSANSYGQSHDIEQQIRAVVLGWSRSWSAADVNAYIAAYSISFKPSDSADNYEQWRTARTNKLKFGQMAKVRLEDITIYLDGNRQQALVQFVQHYQSSTYQDTVIKQFKVVLENDHWLISSERVLDMLD